MNDDRGDFDALQVPDEVEISQTFPYGLLYPCDYAEGGEVARLAWIGEIASDAQLERALSICRRILLLDPRYRELLAQPLDLRPLLPASELLFELAPVVPRQRRRVDQGEPLGSAKIRIPPLLDRME